MHRPKLVPQTEQRGERLPKREGRRRVIFAAGGKGYQHPERRGLRGGARGRPERDAGAGRDLQRGTAVRLPDGDGEVGSIEDEVVRRERDDLGQAGLAHLDLDPHVVHLEGAIQ